MRTLGGTVEVERQTSVQAYESWGRKKVSLKQKGGQAYWWNLGAVNALGNTFGNWTRPDVLTDVLWGVTEKKESMGTLSFLIPCFQGWRTVYVSRGQSTITQCMIKSHGVHIHSTLSDEYNQLISRLKPAALCSSHTFPEGICIHGSHLIPWEVSFRTLLGLVNNNN